MTFNTFAQVANFTEVKSEKEKTCSSVPFEMPSAISTNTDAFTNYIRVMSLPSGARQQAFSALSNEEKATLFKVKMALEFIKRPNLNREQKGLILETLSTLSADSYDKTNATKVEQSQRKAKELENIAVRLFPQSDAYEIFADMNGDKSFEINLLTKYENLLRNGMKARKQIAKNLSLAERLNLWNTQFAYHLATSSLNRQQSEYLLESMTKIPSVFEASRTLTGIERAKYLEALESSMFAVFGKEAAYAIFMEIGIQKTVRDQSDVSVIFMNASAKSSLWNSLNSETSKPQWSCDCRWYCSGGSSCTGNICTTVNYCGPYGEWECTNRCKTSKE